VIGFSCLPVCGLWAAGVVLLVLALLLQSMLCFVGGVNMLGMAVLGEYGRRVLDSVRGRPDYVIEKTDG
jgi:hypothetical protein